MLFVFGIGYGIGKLAGWELSWKQLLLPAVFVFCSYLVLQKKKEIRMVAAAVSACVVLVIIFGICKGIAHFSYWEEFYSYLSHWRFLGVLKEKYVWLVLGVLDSILLTALVWIKKLRFGNEVVTAGSLAFLLLQIGMECKWEKIPVLAVLFVILSGTLNTWKKYRLKQERKEEKNAYLLLGIVLFAAALFPVSEEPVSLQPVWDRMMVAGEWMEKQWFGIASGSGERDFNAQIAGFSDSGQTFFGKLREDTDWEMLMLNGDISTRRVENYFTGTIKEIYENGNWMADSTESLNGLNGEIYTEREWVLEEHLYNLYQAKIPMVENEKFCKRNMYRFTYKDLKSRTVFYPVNCYLVRSEQEQEPIFEEQKRLCFEMPEESGESYQAYGLKLNTEQENFLKYIRGEEQEPAWGEDCFSECMKALDLSDPEVNKITDAGWEPLLAERKRQIQEKDLQLPENFDPEMKKLAIEITKDATNDYDKAVAIQNYLKENNIYCKDVAKPPEGMDAVSYFLFESREGYCTHFASAMTLLCRAAGIPARYVEGIYCNYEKKEENKYLILGSDAHAWTEVYIENFGFLTFDATPGYDATYADWEKHERKGGPVLAQNVMPQKETEKVKPQTAVVREAPLKKRIFMGVWILPVFGCVTLFVLLFLRIKYLCLPKKERARISMKCILKRAGKKGLEIQNDETLRQYTRKIKGELINPKQWEEVVQIYERVYYGEKEITKKELKKIEHYEWKVKT